MFYTGKVKYYNCDDDVTEEYGIFVSADTYIEAVEKIVKHYGEYEMQGFTLDVFSPDGVLEFEDISLHEFVQKTLAEDILW